MKITLGVSWNDIKACTAALLALVVPLALRRPARAGT